MGAARQARTGRRPSALARNWGMILPAAMRPGCGAQDVPMLHNPCEFESAGDPGANPYLSTP